MTEEQLGISRPGKGEQIISPSEAIRRKPDFFSSRPEGVNWTLRIKHLDGREEDLPPGTDWEAVSKFGSVRSAVVTNPDGSPAFDRPRYDEAPNINVVAWGRDKNGEIRVGMISQARPHADNVFDPKDTKSMVFEQIPMGFLDKVIGKDQVERLEHAGEGAARETGEETGAKIVKDISYPEYPHNYPNPTFVGTTSNVVFVEVDLDQIDKHKIDRSEQIYSADYITLKELLSDIEKGKTEKGYARMSISNSVILMFLSHLNSFKNAERNERILSAEGQANKEAKKKDPRAYLAHRLEASKARYPERYAENKARAEKHLKDLRAAEAQPEAPNQPAKPVSKSLLRRVFSLFGK